MSNPGAARPADPPTAVLGRAALGAETAIAAER